MAQVLSPGGVKPRPWRVRPGSVAPEWRWFWEAGPGLVAPFWHGAGAPVDVSSHGFESSLVGSPTWVGSARGWGLNFDGGASERVEFAASDVDDVLGDMAEMAVVAVVQVDTLSTADDDSRIVNKGRNDASDEPNGWSLEPVNGNVYGDDRADAYAWVIGEGTQNRGTWKTPANSLTRGTPQLVTVNWVRGASNTPDIWIDGEKVTLTETQSIGSIDSDLGIPLCIGNDISEGENLQGSVLFVAVVPGLLPETFHERLHRDPFGPFRPTRATIVRVPTDTGTTVSVGQALETDTALGVGSAKEQSVGQSQETDAAQSVTPEKAVTLGLSTESDTARQVTAAKLVDVGQATEADQALAVAIAKVLGVGQATESDTALAVSSSSETIVSVGLATESDTAFGVSVAKVMDVGLASETDAALVVVPAKAYDVGQASEQNSALAVDLDRAYAVGLATESDEALALSAAKALSVGLATETDEALAVLVVGAELDLRPPFTAAWVDPERDALWVDPQRDADWTDPERDATWE